MARVDVLRKDSVRNMIMPISVEQYHKFGESGLIAEKTELMEGIIFRKMTKSPLHEFIASRLYDFFAKRAGNDYWVRKESPLTLATSELEPDISIVRGRIDEFVTRHPDYAELVIEVAVSSLELDREKAMSYAAAGIPEYWIVRPADKLAECYSQPEQGRYRKKQIVTAGQSMPSVWGELILAKLFA